MCHKNILLLCIHLLGFAGSDAKVDYLKGLGFDAAYNYKKVASLDTAIKESCPKGVDLFFDNVRFSNVDSLFTLILFLEIL